MNTLGYPLSRNQARKLMREAGVQVRHRKKYKVTTNSNHKQPVFDNLLQRQFDVPQVDQRDGPHQLDSKPDLISEIFCPRILVREGAEDDPKKTT